MDELAIRDQKQIWITKAMNECSFYPSGYFMVISQPPLAPELVTVQIFVPVPSFSFTSPEWLFSKFALMVAVKSSSLLQAANERKRASIKNKPGKVVYNTLDLG